MVIYYTGTGNSRYTAQALSHMLGDELTDAGTYIKAGRKAHLSSQRPWVFVSPTYSWRIPRIFEAFIRNGRFIGSRQAYFVMTCGDDVGAAAQIHHLRVDGDAAMYHGSFDALRRVLRQRVQRLPNLRQR